MYGTGLMHAEKKAGSCPFLFMAVKAGTPSRDNKAMRNLSLSNQVHDLTPPARVHPTVSMEKKPIPGLTSCLMKRRSCSIRFFKELTRLARASGSFALCNGLGIGHVLLNSDHSRSRLRGVGVSLSGGLFHLLAVPDALEVGLSTEAPSHDKR